MSQTKVKTDNLAKEIVKTLNEYTENVSDATYRAVGEIAKDTQKKMRATRSAGESNVWRRYPLGWTTKSKKKKNRREETVWNQRHYRLTHLLENGHVVKNGTGRNSGRQQTRAFVHIKPVNDDAQKRLEEAIMEAIEKG